MGVKLMTGATGEQNIQAADDRECLAGITGLDSYVFPTGNQLKATLVDSNNVTIGTGAGSLQGSRFRCATTTNVTIQSGTQGQYRRDIIGLAFERDTSGRESMSFKVLTGTPASTAAEAVDPEFTAGDLLGGDAAAFMPLYRVKLTGINVATPEAMFNVITPIAALGESVSHARNALIKTEMTAVTGYGGTLRVSHDGFGTTDSPHGFDADEETFVRVCGFIWSANEKSGVWPSLMKAPWQPDEVKDYWCARIPVEVAKKGSANVGHRSRFDSGCVLYMQGNSDGVLNYYGATLKTLFTSTDGYLYIAMHVTEPGALPCIVYVDATIPLIGL